ncbi:ATP synthase F1 subunit delta [Wolbachia endosymbiont of Howardula sp.]|uniref:ATP synthase F1 subunit delta n=1 Tax=Wolbachia endosymbiont of Howardula sp. TaxID=2916816 RepID=UPI00217D2998|nr:ATP synthase F1 subunit delta [Wolbachia endosymbiont of Howardula sp.]UWI83146.1 ATP synthase F1 subunit delta [Wolbachia endosymbiont of Howardula sp.]
MNNIQAHYLITSYANILFEISKYQLEIYKQEAKMLLHFLRNQDDIFHFLSHPRISYTMKQELILILKQYISDQFIKFIIIVCINKRFNLLLAILEKFLYFVRNSQNEFEIIIISAVLLNKSDIQLITESLTFLGVITKVSNVINPTILGGFIVRYNSYLIDRSLKSYLKRLVHLSQTEILKNKELL